MSEKNIEATRGEDTGNIIKAFSIDLDSRRTDDEHEEKSRLGKFLESHTAQTARTYLLNVVFIGYFAWASLHYYNLRSTCDIGWCDGYGMLLILTVIVYSCLIYSKIAKVIGPSVGKALQPMNRAVSALLKRRIIKFTIVGIALIIFGVFLAFDTQNSRDRLRSLLGIVILIGICYTFSADRSRIEWRTVLIGFVLQFLLGIFCLRMETGRLIFECFGNRVEKFFKFALRGAEFVYGPMLVTEFQVFAFSVLPVIFFFSFIVSILYYFGAMQWIIKKLGSFLTKVLGTTACEGTIVAGNIFLGMTESPLLIKPYMKYLTASEIHVIMASGFATVSGTVLAAYIREGALPSHLITSSVMAAPATLALAKLMYPEKEVSQASAKTISMEKSPEKTVLDAAANGAFAAISLISGIIANLVAFVSFVGFINAMVSWFGALVGHEYVSFEWCFGKLFTPLAYIIGIPWEDCEKVGAVIASKTIINEFVAYRQLDELKSNNLISLRSSAIATFAICGFANFSSLGMMIGNLGTMCPEKRTVITSVAVRALVTGSIVCFLNASIAGLLMGNDTFE